MEAIAAAGLGPDAGDAFLALQGDPWDTHKDMFMALAGATTAMTVTFSVTKWRALRTRALEAVELAAAAMSSTALPLRGSSSRNRD